MENGDLQLKLVVMNINLLSGAFAWRQGLTEHEHSLH